MKKVIYTVSSGGVVVCDERILLLYKSFNMGNGGFERGGWVMPKGTVEPGETIEEAALREVYEEANVQAVINEYIDKTGYSFYSNGNIVYKTVHWFLMETDSFYCYPQREEFFFDAGFYKRHEAINLLKFKDERIILRKYMTENCQTPVYFK